jgi:hypothetical protein
VLIGVLLATAAGCPEEASAPFEAEAPTSAEEPAKAEAPAAAEEPAAAGAPAAADTQAQVEAKLAKADLVDGQADKVVAKCPGCALAMDGSPEYTLEVSGYTLRFCQARCKDTFAQDTTKSILAMEIPED